MKWRNFTYISLLFAIYFGTIGSSIGQGINTLFGQNRIQYSRFEWSFLRTENYDAFFYSGGRELANYSIRFAEETMPELERILDHRLNGRIEIICYNTLGDYKQGNFGLEEITLNTGGFTNVVNNRVLVYFNGDHADLSRQIKEGLALVLLNEMLYGGNIQERLQTAAFLNLPEWYIRGLVAYLSKPWDASLNNKMKDIQEQGTKSKFNRLNQKEPEFAGHAFWKFLTEKYDKESVANLVYITKLTRNYETAIEYVTNKLYKEILVEYLQFYQELYKKESDLLKDFPPSEFKIKKRIAPYIQAQMKVSPKGNGVAFTTNKNGKFKVYLLNTQTGKTKKIFKGGLKYHQLNIDYSFPLVAWQAGGDKIAYVFEKKGVVYLRMIDLVNKKKETIKFLKFDKITGIDFSENGRTLVLSAIRKGQSDIYTYDIQTRKETQITSDFYDDQYPRFVDFSTKILFSSNRIRDSLGVVLGNSLTPENNFDIFMYDLETNSRKLKRLSKTPYLNEIQPIDYNKDYFAYLTEYNGIYNRYACRIEEVYDYTEIQIFYKDSVQKEPDTLIYENNPTWSGSAFEYNGKQINLNASIERLDTIVHTKDIVYTYPLTNYKKSILAHDVAVQTKQVFDLVLDKGRYYIRYSAVEKDVTKLAEEVETYPTMFRLKTGFATEPFTAGPVTFKEKRLQSVNQNPDEIVKIANDTNAYFFVNEYTESTYKRPAFTILKKSDIDKETHKPIKVNAPKFYDVTFFTDKLIAQFIDNSIINTYYQPITPAAGQMFNPGLNGLFKLGMIDLFEDYKINGGVRLAYDLSGFDYFASVETRKKRLDHKLSFYRQSRSGGVPEIRSYKNLSHELRYSLRMPFNPVSCIRIETFFRQDRDITRATDVPTLDSNDKITNWSGGKIEYVFDNTIPKGLNLWNGTRFKVFYERFINLNNTDLQINVLGIDFRHYQKLHRQIIFAGRLSANTSFGPGRVVYYLGGVENWLTPSFNNQIATASDRNYIFQALACNLRGFTQNIRNGNNYALASAEVRIPIFQYVLNRPLRSEFFNNFQIVPFFDIGTAWVGSNPYSDENTFNQKIYEQGPVKAKVINVRDPIVAGTGGGLRSKLFGYFVRFDMAWGIQDFEVTEAPLYYLSLGLDF